MIARRYKKAASPISAPAGFPDCIHQICQTGFFFGARVERGFHGYRIHKRRRLFRTLDIISSLRSWVLQAGASSACHIPERSGGQTRPEDGRSHFVCFLEGFRIERR